MADVPSESAIEGKPVPHCRDYHSNNPVLVLKDTVAAVVLGVISLALMVSLLRALARNRRLERELAGLLDATEE